MPNPWTTVRTLTWGVSIRTRRMDGGDQQLQIFETDEHGREARVVAEVKLTAMHWVQLTKPTWQRTAPVPKERPA